MACSALHESGWTFGSQNWPLMMQLWVVLSQVSLGQSESRVQEQKDCTPVSPVPTHCGTHWRLLGSQTAPRRLAASQSSLTTPPCVPAWLLAGSQVTLRLMFWQAARPAVGSQFTPETSRTSWQV